MQCKAANLGWPLNWDWAVNNSWKLFRKYCRKVMAEDDAKGSLVWLPNFLQYNQPESPNVVKACPTALDLLSECELKRELFLRLEAFARGLAEAFHDPFAESLRGISPNQEQKQEPDKDQGPKQEKAVAANATPRSPWAFRVNKCEFEPQNNQQTSLTQNRKRRTRLPEQFAVADEHGTHAKQRGVDAVLVCLSSKIKEPYPKCLEEYQTETQNFERQRHERRQRERLALLRKQCDISARFQVAAFDNYCATLKGQQTALQSARRFAGDFTEIAERGSTRTLAGTSGTGKTHLDCAIGNSLLAQGCSVNGGYDSHEQSSQSN